MKRILFEIIENRNIRNDIGTLGGSSAGDRQARIRCGGQLEYCDVDPLCLSSYHEPSRNTRVSPVVNVRFTVPEREGQAVAFLAFDNPLTERMVVSSSWACHVEFVGVVG